jgi:hypothetical protein
VSLGSSRSSKTTDGVSGALTYHKVVSGGLPLLGAAVDDVAVESVADDRMLSFWGRGFACRTWLTLFRSH